VPWSPVTLARALDF